MTRFIGLGIGVVAGIATVAMLLTGGGAATARPSDGRALHIDAKLHFPGKPDMIAHHWCKAVRGGMTECLLYDGDTDDARLVGAELIVGPDAYQKFSAAEKKLWHFHKIYASAGCS